MPITPKARAPPSEIFDLNDSIKNFGGNEMQNWHKYRNYRKSKNVDGSYTYIIKVEDKNVEVSQEIYREYAKIGRKMEYMECDLKRDRMLRDETGSMILDENGLPIPLSEREESLEKLVCEGWDFPSSAPSPEESIVRQDELASLHLAFGLLNADERALIEALFFEDCTERAYSAKTGIAQKTINDRKQMVLGTLKNILQKNEK